MISSSRSHAPSASSALERPLRLLDLFSGIGGFSLGLESTGGFETIAFCEISPKCRFLLNYHWPNVPCFDDVRTLKGTDVGEVDAICGGFPCQDISFAGRGAGIDGERSGLWREYARLIGELRPAYVIVENVSALLVRGMGTVLGDLAALGYDAWWDCIPASAVGAPHRRDRLWLVAYAYPHTFAGELVAQGFAGEASRSESCDAGEGQASDGQRVWAELGAGRALSDTDREGEPAGAVDAGMVADASRFLSGRPEQRAERQRARQGREPIATGGRWSEGYAHARGSGQRDGPHARSRLAGSSWWLTEPDVGRVAHGVPARVDRLHGLGNAVVPQIPALIGRAILAAESNSRLQSRNTFQKRVEL